MKNKRDRKEMLTHLAVLVMSGSNPLAGTIANNMAKGSLVTMATSREGGKEGGGAPPSRWGRRGGDRPEVGADQRAVGPRAVQAEGLDDGRPARRPVLRAHCMEPGRRPREERGLRRTRPCAQAISHGGRGGHCVTLCVWHYMA